MATILSFILKMGKVKAGYIAMMHPTLQIALCPIQGKLAQFLSGGSRARWLTQAKTDMYGGNSVTMIV